MRKLWLKIKLALNYLFTGLRGADKVISGEEGFNTTEGSAIVQQNEQNSVYKDLLKGEITQEVRELRHEMYYSERASKKYQYIGGGLSEKRNELYVYNGNADRSDGFPIQIVQQNSEDTGTLSENLSEKDFRIKETRNFTIQIERDYIPRFKIEEYTSQLIVKRINETKVLLDFYVSKYPKKFDRRQTLFLREVNRVYMGDKHSDIVTFDKVHFITSNAFGAPDLKGFCYNNIQFDNIVEFDGSYVLKFLADIEADGDDLVNEFYDAIANKKFEEHAPRKEYIPVLDIGLFESKKKQDFDSEKNLDTVKEIWK
jgi:hypothetical protein